MTATECVLFLDVADCLKIGCHYWHGGVCTWGKVREKREEVREADRKERLIGVEDKR